MATKRQLKTGIVRFMDLVTERQQLIHTETFNLCDKHIATPDRVNEKLGQHGHLVSIQNGLQVVLDSLGGRQVKPTSSAQATRLGTEIQQHIAHLYLTQVENNGQQTWDLHAAWRFINSKPAVKQIENVGLAIFGPQYGDDLEAVAEATAEPIPDNVKPIA